ncbi:MAG TPA: diguanylate cyclase [Azospira sp.]|nr:diguanylate cyclase [Azospira sp.]HNN08830.1 diguanylate cyclase [Azospira sp.]HNN44466.1 diguanylate cyclase [Azospira sp.]
MNRSLTAEKRATAQAQTRSDCMRQLGRLAPGSGFAIIAGALLISYWLRDLAPGTLLGVWLGALLLLGASRFVFAFLVRYRFDESRFDRWEMGYAALTGVTGLIWGLLAWMPIPDPEHNRLFIIVVLLFCILLVSSSTLVASTRVLSSFAVGLATPLVARTLTLDGDLAILFSLGLLVTGGVTVLAVRSHRSSLMAAMLDRHEAAAVLQQQRVIFESAGEGIVFLKPKPEYVVSCNRRFTELFGYSQAEMIGMPPWRWHPDRIQWKALVEASLPILIDGRPYHDVLRLRRADGTEFWCDVTGMAVAGSDLAAGTVWVISDISDKRAAEAALRMSEERFRNLVKLSSDLYWEQDADFRFTHFDGPDDFTRRLPTGRILGKTRWEASDILGVHQAMWEHHIATLRRHEPFRDFVYQINGSDGHKYWLSINGNPMFDDAGRFVGYHGTASDITLRIEAEERFRHLAYHDTLTRLPNRRLLSDRLDQAVRNAARNGHRVALLLIDLDGFKKVNDQHGHAAGDRVLEAVAARLREAVREADTVARMGGDEFVVLLPEIGSTEDAVMVADKIHGAINEPIADGLHNHAVGSSIGISIFPDHGDSAEALLHRADHAMYHGKSRGGKTTRLFDASSLN